MLQMSRDFFNENLNYISFRENLSRNIVSKLITMT